MDFKDKKGKIHTAKTYFDVKNFESLGYKQVKEPKKEEPKKEEKGDK